MNGVGEYLAFFHFAAWIFPPASEAAMRAVVRAAADPEAAIPLPHGSNDIYNVRLSRRGGLRSAVVMPLQQLQRVPQQCDDGTDRQERTVRIVRPLRWLSRRGGRDVIRGKDIITEAAQAGDQ
jgi:hypothetical protein